MKTEINEELEEELDENELDEEEVKVTKQVDDSYFTTDPVERLTAEIEEAKINVFKTRIGEYLLERIKKDEILAKKYNDYKITLTTINEYIYSVARENAGTAQSAAFTDDVVFGWLIDGIDENKIKGGVEKKPKPEAKKKEEKAKEKLLPDNQMSLFDLED